MDGFLHSLAMHVISGLQLPNEGPDVLGAQLEVHAHSRSLKPPKIASRPDDLPDAALGEGVRAFESESFELAAGLVPELDADLAALEIGPALVQPVRKLGIQVEDEPGAPERQRARVDRRHVRTCQQSQVAVLRQRGQRDGPAVGPKLAAQVAVSAAVGAVVQPDLISVPERTRRSQVAGVVASDLSSTEERKTPVGPAPVETVPARQQVDLEGLVVRMIHVHESDVEIPLLRGRHLVILGIDSIARVWRKHQLGRTPANEIVARRVTDGAQVRGIRVHPVVRRLESLAVDLGGERVAGPGIVDVLADAPIPAEERGTVRDVAPLAHHRVVRVRGPVNPVG